MRPRWAEPRRRGARNDFSRSILRIAFGVIVAFISWIAGASAQVPSKEEWDKVLAAAKVEGKVVFYSAQTPLPLRALVESFQKAHPEIPVESFRAVSADLTNKISQELAAGVEGADVVVTTDVGWLGDLSAAKKLVKPIGPDAAKWPANYIVNDAMVIAATEVDLIIYNTSLIKDPPRGYKDLLKPEYKGKVGISELTATALIAFYEWLEKTQGADYLVKLKEQNPRFFVGSGNLTQATGVGEVALGLFGTSGATIPLMKQGAPVNYVIPDPALGNNFGLGILAASKHKNAALVFTNYLMSVAGQTAWHGSGISASPLNVPGAMQVNNIVSWDPSAYSSDVQTKYTEHWNRIMKGK